MLEVCFCKWRLLKFGQDLVVFHFRGLLLIHLSVHSPKWGAFATHLFSIGVHQMSPHKGKSLNTFWLPIRGHQFRTLNIMLLSGHMSNANALYDQTDLAFCPNGWWNSFYRYWLFVNCHLKNISHESMGTIWFILRCSRKLSMVEGRFSKWF